MSTGLPCCVLIGSVHPEPAPAVNTAGRGRVYTEAKMPKITAAAEIVGLFPIEAADWLRSMGYESWPFPSNPRQVIMAIFRDERETRHYARRWNGLVGKNYRDSRRVRKGAMA